jgi:hypothetical protein
MEVVKEKQGQQNRGQKEAHKEAPQPLVLREFEGKSIWSWLRLLIVPLSLAHHGRIRMAAGRPSGTN